MFILLLTFIFRKYLSTITLIFFSNNPTKIILKIFQGLFYIFFNKQFFLLFIFTFIFNFVEISPSTAYCQSEEEQILLIPKYTSTYLDQNFNLKIYVKKYDTYHNTFMAKKSFIDGSNFYVSSNLVNDFVNCSIFNTDSILVELQQLDYFLSKIHLKKALIMPNFTGHTFIDESIIKDLTQKLVQIDHNADTINYKLPQIVKDSISKSVDQQINWNQIFNCLGLFSENNGIFSDDNSSRFSGSSIDTLGSISSTSAPSSPMLNPTQMQILITDIDMNLLD